MKRIILSITIALLAWLSFSCRGSNPTAPGGTSPKAQSRALTSGEAAVANAGNDFAFRLFSQLASASPGRNVFCSPLSVSMALGMTINGAAGSTFDSMQACMGISGMSRDAMNQSYQSLTAYLTSLDPGTEVHLSNSIWYANWLNILSKFVEVNQTYFHAAVMQMDFSNPGSAGIINNWILQNTNGKITEVIQPPIAPATAMLLINTTYFKGFWIHKFNPRSTGNGQFTWSDGSTHVCKMMNQGLTVPCLSYQGISGVDLPYGDSLFSMTLLLPPAGTDIRQWIQGLNASSWNVIINNLSARHIYLAVPKFKLEYSTLLKTSLTAMGMRVAFGGGADFSRVASNPGMSISDVIHKTFVQVDEEGTEAAAVTVVKVITAAPGEYFTFDRPFVYAIREIRSGTILFIGVMEQPVF